MQCTALGVLMRLATSQFRYEDSGLLDRTHIRWFTRTTMIEVFTQATGWRIENRFSRQIPTAPRIFDSELSRRLPEAAAVARTTTSFGRCQSLSVPVQAAPGLERAAPDTGWRMLTNFLFQIAHEARRIKQHTACAHPSDARAGIRRARVVAGSTALSS